MNVCPAMVKVPVRGAPEFDATMKFTVPPLVPDAPPEIVIHGTLLTAVHVQPLAVITFTLPLPPISLKLATITDREYEQPEA